MNPVTAGRVADLMNRVGRFLLNAQSGIGASDKETALLALRLARQDLDLIISLVESP